MNYTYKISETGHGSKRFGPCELTGEEAAELVILKKYKGKGLVSSTFCTNEAAKAAILDNICPKVAEAAGCNSR